MQKLGTQMAAASQRAPVSAASPGPAKAQSVAPAGTAPKSKLLDQARLALRARHYSRRTEEVYLYWMKKYILFHGKRRPAEMGETEINAFLTHLAVKEQVAASTQNQALAAPAAVSQSALRVSLPHCTGFSGRRDQRCRASPQTRPFAGSDDPRRSQNGSESSEGRPMVDGGPAKRDTGPDSV